jgi:nitric oxide reductase subunit B
MRRKDEQRSIVSLLFMSTVAIGLFYGAGLMCGRHTHISMVEYLRWWVVHLWVEGFFEVFAIGASFSALEVVPLALYYMQGLNLTPLHGHTALFGVYGMLGIGLMLFTLRLMKPEASWSDALLGHGFAALNIGLMLMALMCLLPMGVLQGAAAIDHDYWYARSAEFMQRPVIETLVWLRVPGDVIFSIGALCIAWFVARLWIAPRQQPKPLEAPPAEPGKSGKEVVEVRA